MSDDEEEGEIVQEIDVKILFDEKFENREDLKDQLTKWSCLNKMKLNFKTKERINTKGIKTSTLYCSKKAQNNCKFYLEFQTDENSHYKLVKYFNFHNHNLEIFDNAQAITEEIYEQIKSLKTINADTPTIASIINKGFKTNFHWRTIYYQLSKITDEECGGPSQDASKLIQILEKDANSRSGFYKAEINEKGELSKVYYMTNRMRKFVNSFKDVIIIDTHTSPIDLRDIYKRR